MLVNTSMNMTEKQQQQQQQQQQNPEHTTLDIENNNSLNNELEKLTDEYDHKHNLNEFEDIDDIDGRISRVPKSIPETDDEDDDDDRPNFLGPRIGVDDGLLPDAESGRPSRPPSRRPSFSFPGYAGTGFVDIDGVNTAIPDINAYQHKKTLAQGMMDLALLSANANQLRYVIESYGRHPYYYPSLVLISLSIICQIVVGIGLIVNSKYNVKKDKDICRANKINNYTVIGIFIVTVVNVFISAFGVADPVSEINK